MIIARADGHAGSSSERDGLSAMPPVVKTSVSHFPAAYSPVRIFHVGAERATYAPFRETFFHDPAVNPVLRGEGSEPDRLSIVRESKRTWTAAGPRISSRSPKTVTCPGSAFKNQGVSADRLYSTSRNSIGYDVHRSLRGTSLCSTTKRFDQKAPTPESVGPGSYNVLAPPSSHAHRPSTEPPKLGLIVTNSDRLKQWGGAPDARPMDCADEWKTTSEKPTPTVYTFQRARNASWIEQIEERQRRTNPEARPLPPSTSPARPLARKPPEQRLPDFLQGTRNPIATKHGATAVLLGESTAQARSERGRESPMPTPAGVVDPLDTDNGEAAASMFATDEASPPSSQ